MYTIEIEGHTYVYKNDVQLKQLMKRREESLCAEAATLQERLVRVRSERRAIAKYTGIPLKAKEERETDVPAMTGSAGRVSTGAGHE